MVINVKLFLPIYESLAGLVAICLDWLIHRFDLFTQYQTIILVAGIGLLVLAAISVSLLFRRCGFVNYCKSLSDTSDLRTFLRIPNTVNDFTSKTKYDPIQKIYNYALWHTYIEYGKKSMQVWIAIPNNADAQAILDKKMKRITSKLNSYTNKYLCSTYERVGEYYVYKGEKK